MKIKYNGNEYDAYALVMTKENALEILNGMKRVEIREYSPHYESIFIDKKIADANQEITRDEDWQNPIKSTPAVHFYSTGADWTLDVSIDDIGIASLIPEDIAWLQDEYDFHDLDEKLEECKDMPEDEVPMFFYIGIEKILNHSGLVD